MIFIALSGGRLSYSRLQKRCRLFSLVLLTPVIHLCYPRRHPTRAFIPDAFSSGLSILFSTLPAPRKYERKSVTERTYRRRSFIHKSREKFQRTLDNGRLSGIEEHGPRRAVRDVWKQPRQHGTCTFGQGTRAQGMISEDQGRRLEDDVADIHSATSASCQCWPSVARL